VTHRVVRTHEVERESYARNDAMRCYHCKTELYAVLSRVVESAPVRSAILAGANADDAEDFRPGLWAGTRAGVRNPLLEERVSKGEVRAIARVLDLRVADKPALACLSSRVELGIRVTPDLLARIDAAERLVRRLGFDLVRVRHHGEVATIEVESSEVGRLRAHPGLPATIGEVVALGWDDVRVDPEGYRHGGTGPHARSAAPEGPQPGRLSPGRPPASPAVR
jgi:uncharacterized protein